MYLTHPDALANAAALLRRESLTRVTPREAIRNPLEPFGRPAEVISSLPEVFARMGWSLSAALMRAWLDEDGLETMDVAPGYFRRLEWPVLLRFERVRNALEKGVNMLDVDRWPTDLATLTSETAHKALVRSIQAGGRSFGNIALGEIGPYAEAQHYLGSVQLPFSTAIDDLLGSLGDFSLRFYAVGEVLSSSPASAKLRVLRYAVRVRDSFDFEGDQYLGEWTPAGLAKWRTAAGVVLDHFSVPQNWTPGGPVSLHNSDFQQYKSNTKKGTDFLVLTPYADPHALLGRQAPLREIEVALG